MRQSATTVTRSTIFNGSVIALILVTLMVMSRSWFQMSLVTYLPGWMQNQGWSLTAAGQILSVHLLSISVGSFSGGPLSDRIGRWQVVLLSFALLGPVYWAFLNTTGIIEIALVALIGVLVGWSFPVTIVMAQESWPRGVGLASALALGLGWLPGGIGASVTGYIADQTSLITALQSLFLAIILGLIVVIAFAVLQRQIADQHPITETP